MFNFDDNREKLNKLLELCVLPNHLSRDGKHYIVPSLNLLWGSVDILWGIDFKRDCGEWHCRDIDDAIKAVEGLRSKMY